MNFAPNLSDLHLAMEACEQAPGLNMLQHGQAVHAAYRTLIAQLESNTCSNPMLTEVYARFTWPDPQTLERYHVYHDCGKHLVAIVNDEGKRQFPGHARASAEQYARLFPDDTVTEHLIAHDMDFHTLRGDDLLTLCQDPLAPILYLTAWAEVHANAEMFGGTHTDSFKIKAKRLIQAGKKLLTFNPIIPTGEHHA